MVVMFLIVLPVQGIMIVRFVILDSKKLMEVVLPCNAMCKIVEAVRMILFAKNVFKIMH